MSFVNLAIKSGYSFFDSTLKVSDIVNYAKHNNLSTIALVDDSNMFGAMEFYKLCKKENIKPIIGMQINYLEGDGRSYPLILLAKNIEGYQTLCKLTSVVSKGSLNISLSKEELKNYTKGLIAILPISNSYLKMIDDLEYADYLDFFRDTYDFYLGLELYSKDDEEYLDVIREIAYIEEYKTVALNVVNYMFKDDHKYLEVLKAVEANQPINKIDFPSFEGHYFKDDNEIRHIFSEEEVEASEIIADNCNVDITSLKGSLVTYPVPNGVSQKDYLYALCYKGLEKRLSGKQNKAYLDRLNYELKIITNMGYTNYFLVVYDYVKFAKTHNILVGPGRGSAAGSLVAYVLGITNIDPLKYDLLFERFLNPERVSMPDIDLDFIDSRRDEIIEYLCSKYGLDRCAHVIAFQTFGARQAFRDTFKAMGMSLVEVDALSKRMPKDINLTLKDALNRSPSFKALINSRANYKEMYEVAMHFEGLPRQTTLHAAGMVISDKVLTETSPIYYPSENVSATQYDMNYIEDIGLLKMDVLGLKNLRIIDAILNKIKQVYGKELNINNIPLDDPKVFNMICKLQVSGVFQLESPGMKRAIHTLAPSSFDDVVALLALFRPGPMGYISVYAERKKGKEKVTYLDPCLESILKPTYGIIIYQEQIMQILVEMAGFSLGQADIVRRAISKKVESKLIEIEKDFIEGSIKNNHSKEVAKKVFDMIVKFANYGFNKAHSVSYAYITYQMAYLKYYFPAIFFSEVLNTFASNNDSKFNDYIQEIRNRKIKLLKPSINKSFDLFTLENKDIRYSLRNIKGVTPGLVSSLVEERKNGEFKDFPSFVARMKPLGLTQVQTLALISAGALDEFGYNRDTLTANIANNFIYADIVASSVEGQLSLNYNDNPPPEMILVERNLQQELDNEFDVLGFFLSGFPLIYERKRIQEKGFICANEAINLEEKVKVVVYISSYKTIKTKNGDYMASLRTMDETGELNITVFPQEFNEFEHLIKKGNYIQVVGVMQQKDLPSLVVKQMKIFNLKEGA
ncbi:MAG: DNA polymerase III subunit alpha [Bacilli bacterium]|nr:DNA polymerase III subunit alpha [Bacilli bacterium]